VLLGGSTIPCSGNVGFSGSIGCVGVSGLNTLAASVLNSSVTLFASLVGGMPRLDKSIGSNMDVGGNCCVLLLGVLVITGVCTGVSRLLKGDVLGPGPITRR